MLLKVSWRVDTLVQDPNSGINFYQQGRNLFSSLDGAMGSLDLSEAQRVVKVTEEEVQ